MNKEAVDRAINNYYKLKNDYETPYNKKKNGIIRNKALSKSAKRRQFNRIRRKCINCNRGGGTIFSNENMILKAVCGNTAKPCKLNIEIKKGWYMQVSDMKDIILKDLENNKSEIIKTKLNYLFGYITETEVTEQFETAKYDYVVDQRIYASLEKKDDAVLSKNKEDISEIKASLYLYIDEFRQIIKNYFADTNVTYLRDANEVYISKIVPATERLRKIKYQQMRVDYNEEDDEYILIQEETTLEDTEMLLGNEGDYTKVISDIQ
jgi:hypothetical protein